MMAMALTGERARCLRGLNLVKLSQARQVFYSELVGMSGEAIGPRTWAEKMKKEVDAYKDGGRRSPERPL